MREMRHQTKGKHAAIEALVGGLYTDGGHHKQAAIEDALVALGVDMEALEENSGEWEEGIP